VTAAPIGPWPSLREAAEALERALSGEARLYADLDPGQSPQDEQRRRHDSARIPGTHKSIGVALLVCAQPEMDGRALLRLHRRYGRFCHADHFRRIDNPNRQAIGVVLCQPFAKDVFWAKEQQFYTVSGFLCRLNAALQDDCRGIIAAHRVYCNSNSHAEKEVSLIGKLGYPNAGQARYKGED
jgi:hypothetical protein